MLFLLTQAERERACCCTEVVFVGWHFVQCLLHFYVLGICSLKFVSQGSMWQCIHYTGISSTGWNFNVAEMCFCPGEAAIWKRRKFAYFTTQYWACGELMMKWIGGTNNAKGFGGASKGSAPRNGIDLCPVRVCILGIERKLLAKPRATPTSIATNSPWLLISVVEMRCVCETKIWLFKMYCKTCCYNESQI